MFIELFIHFKIIFSEEIFQEEVLKEKGKLMRTQTQVQLCYQCVLFCSLEQIIFHLLLNIETLTVLPCSSILVVSIKIIKREM